MIRYYIRVVVLIAWYLIAFIVNSYWGWLWFIIFLALWSIYASVFCKPGYLIRILTGSLESKNGWIRRDAIKELRRYATRNIEAYRTIESAQNHQDEKVAKIAEAFINRYECPGEEGKTKRITDRTNRISGIKKYQPDAVPVLIRALSDESGLVKFTTCRKLEEFGFAAAEALPKLYDLKHNDPSSDIRKAAEDAIRVIQPRPFEELKRMLSSETPTIRRYAVDALAYAGLNANETLPQLREMSEADANFTIRRAARATIRKLEGGQSGENEGK